MFWIAAELPPEIPASCIVTAAEHYSVPAEILVAVAQVEGGEVGKRYVRSHGTYFGPYQISNKWLPVFEKWGYTAEVLQHNACANTAAGAYVLAYYQLREQDWLRAIARYNVGSLNTDKRRDAGDRYVQKVLSAWQQIYTKWNLNSQSSGKK